MVWFMCGIGGMFVWNVWTINVFLFVVMIIRLLHTQIFL